MTLILTVEDEALLSEYLRESLEAAGHAVIATTNADEAIAILESRNDIRVLITDVNMPGSMDGLKLAAAVRKRWPPIKVIVTTGRGAPREMPDGTQFLPKPYEIEKLIATLGHLQ